MKRLNRQTSRRRIFSATAGAGEGGWSNLRQKRGIAAAELLFWSCDQIFVTLLNAKTLHSRCLNMQATFVCIRPNEGVG